MAKAGKKIVKLIKLQITAGKANPAPPIGPALGSAGVNIMAFCKEFNARTQAQAGDILPVVITVYADKSITFITKKPPVSRLILKALGKDKGSGVPNRNKIGQLTMDQVLQIAKDKLEDLNATNLQAAARLIMGTARSMGVDIIESQGATPAAPAA